MLTSSCLPSRVRTRPRRGRLLVECLVAMLLLDASAMVVVSLARGVSASSQSARGTAAAWSLAVQGTEAGIAAPCTTSDDAGLDALPMVTVSWSERSQGRWREREVQAAVSSSALVGATPTRLSWHSARLCP